MKLGFLCFLDNSLQSRLPRPRRPPLPSTLHNRHSVKVMNIRVPMQDGNDGPISKLLLDDCLHDGLFLRLRYRA